MSWASTIENNVCKKYPDIGSFIDTLTENHLNAIYFWSSDCSGDHDINMTIPIEQLSLTTCTDFNQLFGSDIYDGYFGRVYTMNQNVPGAKGATYNYKTPNRIVNGGFENAASHQQSCGAWCLSSDTSLIAPWTFSGQSTYERLASF
jgi:hypothetical protein